MSSRWPGFGKGRKFGGDHHGGCIFERRVDPRRQGKAKTRHRAFHALCRIIEAVIASACKAHNNAIAGQLVRAQPLKLTHDP